MHVTRQKLYKGDEPNLAKARAKINEEFKNHKTANQDEIPELIDVAKQVEQFYRTQVVQAVPKDDGIYSELSRILIGITNQIENVQFLWSIICLSLFRTGYT